MSFSPIQAAIFSLAFSLLSSASSASTITLLLESDANASQGAEIFYVTYDSFDDFLTNTISSQGASQLDLLSTFSIGGAFYDGQYRLLLESDANASQGAEVFHVTYDSFDDFLTNTISSQGASQLDLLSTFSIGGAFYDGQYRLLLESDANASQGAEIFHVTYDSFDDFLTNTISSQGASQLDLLSTFSIGGAFYDGQYRLLLESDANASQGAEIFHVTYDSFDDFLTNTISSQGASQLDLLSTYSVAGVFYVPDVPISPVPVPASGLFLISVLGIGVLGSRRVKTAKSK